MREEPVMGATKDYKEQILFKIFRISVFMFKR